MPKVKKKFLQYVCFKADTTEITLSVKERWGSGGAMRQLRGVLFQVETARNPFCGGDVK